MICCDHSFGEDGVCTCCKEAYSAEHDKRPDDIHPAMARIVEHVKRTMGKPCTCDNCLGSSCACRVDAGERLGELWYCRKRAESVHNQ